MLLWCCRRMDQLLSLWKDFQEAEKMHTERIGDIETRLLSVKSTSLFRSIKNVESIFPTRRESKAKDQLVCKQAAQATIWWEWTMCCDLGRQPNTRTVIYKRSYPYTMCKINLAPVNGWIFSCISASLVIYNIYVQGQLAENTSISLGEADVYMYLDVSGCPVHFYIKIRNTVWLC
jgi:hypothetical protein